MNLTLTIIKIMATQQKQEKFDLKRFERPGLTLEEIQEIKDAFDLFDVDGNQ